MNTLLKNQQRGFACEMVKNRKKTNLPFFIILLLFLFSAPSVYAQIIENYEGTPITMTMMKGGAADLSTLTVVTNPSATGINTSAKVCRLFRDKDGVPWEGFWSNKTVDVTTNKFVHIKVYKTRISTLKFKIEGGAAGTLEIASKYAQTKVNQWEDIVFDFSIKTGIYPIIAFMPDFSDPVNLGADITLYFDDIIVNNSPTPITTVANYTIAGNSGVAAATLTYTGGTVTSNALGNYSITVASGWSGTVTPSKAEYTFTPAKRTYTNVVANQTAQNYTATTGTENPTITAIFQSSYKLYKDTRLANGIYLDALAINAGNKPASIVGCGIGLVSLAIADAMYQKTGDATNWENNAAAMAIQTIQTLIGFKNNGKTNGAGLFHRYFDQNTGDLTGTWTGEYSTADNAIFAFGLIICKNYFSGNTTLVNAANTLLSAMDYTKAIYTTNIAMVLDQSGNVGSAFTIPWNEYIMVAWLAKNANPSNPGYAKSQTFWNTYFANPRTSPCTHPAYSGYELLSDAGFCSSFTAQFPYYYVNYFKNNADYMWYYNNWRNADWIYQGGATYEWGLGAGEVPGGGYSADRINDNPNNIVSPHIIAGFIPIYAQSKADLLSLYNNGTGPAVYSLPSNGAQKVLWRYSRNNTALRTPYIQSVDFSTMLYGLASLPEYLGPNWFTSYNMPSNLKSESLNDEEIHTSLSVYPNPVTDFLHVDLKENSSAIVGIYALDGRLIHKVKLENRSNTIDVRQLKRTGVIIVQVNSENEISTHRVMIK